MMPHGLFKSVVRDTLPANPLTPVSVMIELPVDLSVRVAIGVTGRVSDDGLAPMAKSPAETTVKVTEVEANRLPLVALITTLYVERGVDNVVEMVRAELFCPYAVRVTTVGWRDQVGHDGQTGGGEEARDTLPTKSFILVRMIESDAEDP